MVVTIGPPVVVYGIRRGRDAELNGCERMWWESGQTMRESDAEERCRRVLKGLNMNNRG
jgi:hypothetical protein